MQEESAVIADFTCAVCDKADSVDSLLQCDFCDKWYHYECAHVDKTVETRAWWCAECEVKTKLASGKKDDEIARLKREMEALKATTEKALALIREKDAEVARLNENILRLQGALRGKALGTVQGRLRHADNLEEILSALEKSYGRPDVLVNTLLEQIRESPPIKSERLDSFIEYGDLVAEICSTIKASGTSDRLYDAALLQELVDRMPAYLRWSWGMHSQELKSVTMSEFGAWIQKATDGAMAVTPPQLKKKTTTRQVHAQHVETHQPQPNRHRECALCNSDTCGTIAECQVFNRLSVADRWDKVRTLKLCKRCLGKHYGPCSKRDDCGVQGCVAKHHRKLHRVTSEERVEINHHGTRSDGTLLRYVPVKLHGESGPIYTHALLDEGSTVTLMEQELARQLGVSGVLDSLCLQYSAGERRDERDSERVAVQVSSAEENASAFSMADVRTVSRLSLHIQSVDVNELKRKYKHLQAIPAASYEAVSPRLLIGIDHYRLTRPLKTIEGQPGQPTATKTRLGWLIFGKCTDNANDTSIVQPESSYHVCDCQGETSRADRMMAAYFEVEGYGPAKEPLLSKEDQRAMSILQNNTKHVDGRYTTGLLWRSDNVFMPENRQMALSRMECLERKMSRNTSLAEKINEILEDYLEKGYARPIREDELKTFYPRKWYLPVFPVTNPNKPNKVRLVWDAAAEVRGISLNKKLLTGPDLLTPLQAVLFRFREYRVAVAADIREMYHQVRICDDDVHSQRFLWRWGNTNAEPQEFVMLRMTFGAACSPSTAQFVKNENAEKYRSLYPRAVRCIHEEHYVDDMLTSVETEPEAIELAYQEVWRLHLGWDDEVPEEIQHKWDAWMERLPELESFIIPRCYRQLASLTESSLQLHVFVDAGADGYAAVAYFRFECHGRIEVSLVGSKARVAPLKYLSVPRLELQAAVMGCRIASSITSAHRETIRGSYFWTDSTDVIDWINADHRKYSIFVAHRVAEVLDTTNVDDWRWLPTKLNVADEAIKWTNLQHHLASERWFSGPEFLQLPEAEWNIPRRVPSETSEEVRKKDRLKLVGIHIARPIFIDYERFSRWTRLVRTMAYECRTFSYTGIDYFGPMVIVNGRKTEKRWGVLFTCLTVRAVHIELVQSLSTSDCLMAVRSFMARRGTPIEIVSDRGTNFVGADRELKEAAERVDSAILNEFGSPDPVWKFNPLAAPHFGGSWERMIQSVKRMLSRTLTERHPTEAVLSAALIEVENMLNSRPLTHVPVDGEDEEP
ncbi:uncharacterized protein LOC120905736 [Anopheles arabiensis]|uniref:uncharacterized protein LOC120905736 n=1 Tax=Anopheles arabiensis TaxID=7173 RepID=UPI001AADB6E8|nr:uncharacterized protein LOC120905736 [Anopheles arabiensis]